MRCRKRNLVMTALRCSVMVLLAFLCLFDFWWRPILLSSARSQAKVLMVRQINQAIQKTLSDMENQSFVNLIKDSDGVVRSLSVDSALVNRFKCSFLSLYDADSADVLTFRTTVGTLSCWSCLNGVGPYITFSAEIAHSPNVTFTSSFESTGINQTIHRVLFHVSIDVGYLFPGGSETDCIETDYLLAETVIVSEVPSVYGTIHTID